MHFTQSAALNCNTSSGRRPLRRVPVLRLAAEG
jgi:hypothetical protein